MTDSGIYGLIGRKLGHSFSPAIHHALGNSAYELFEVEPDELGNFVANPQLKGVNVTIPYKQTVMPFLDEIDPLAQEIGAVNTIVRKPQPAGSSKLTGYNTDAIGFSYLLDQVFTADTHDLSGEKVVVAGSGGASLTVQAVIKSRGGIPVVISRSGPVTYADLDDHKDAVLLVNATPVGMSPHVESMPLDPAVFPRARAAIDLIYNPLRTRFLQAAEQAGIKAINGLGMLVVQAIAAHEYFFDTNIAPEKTTKILSELQNQVENIVLIGMPGSGKSSIGRKLSKLANRPLVDLDAEIEKTAGMSIPKIFSLEGEDGFRERESGEVEKAGKTTGSIIVCGGGVITREQNYAPLHQQGRIYHIERDISELSREGRPLSEGANLHQMYESRKAQYQAFRDMIVHNDGGIEEAAQAIWKDFSHEDTRD